MDDKFYYIEKYHEDVMKKEQKSKKKNSSKSSYVKAEFLFSYSMKNDLWVSLLEKAYAKAYECYWNIGTGGYGHEALMDLTGAPAENFSMTDFVSYDSYLGEKESKTPEIKDEVLDSVPAKIENRYNALFRRLYFCSQFGYLMNASVKGTGYEDIGNGLRAGMR